MDKNIEIDCSSHFSLEYSFPLDVLSYSVPIFIICSLSSALLYRKIYRYLLEAMSHFSTYTPTVQQKFVYHCMRAIYFTILFVFSITGFVKVWYNSAETSVTCSSMLALFSIIAGSIVYTVFLLDILLNSNILIGVLIHHISTSLSLCYYMIVGMHDRGFVLIALGYALYESLCLFQSITLIVRRIPSIRRFHAPIMFSNLIGYALRMLFQLIYIPFILIKYNELFTIIRTLLHIFLLILQTLLNSRIWLIFYKMWKDTNQI